MRNQRKFTTPYPKLDYHQTLSGLPLHNVPCEALEFKTSDKITLRGWLFTPSDGSAKLSFLIMAYGFCALKAMDPDTFAEHFVSKLPLACLVYDNRGFDARDQAEGQPRQEIIPPSQMADYSNAITSAQSLDEVDPEKMDVIHVSAADRRLKAALCQMPLVQGFENFASLVTSDVVPATVQMWHVDRLARQSGKEAQKVSVVTNDSRQPAALPIPDSYDYFTEFNSMELLRAHDLSHLIRRIRPTPLIMTVANNDVLTPTDLALEAHSRAREPRKPKELHIIPGGRIDGHSGSDFERNAGRQVELLRSLVLGSQLAASRSIVA
ncbi:hypothetical protein DOTSEDRAFT_31159 [Dothistroma septosporum NZE10]|uniref:AB hydrolase-1 domain-containing protein n=1 Tax=Dothistroma septosporum (strain NZE10 / CBS 128990) TaxID=675120 RepID=N1Q455_DOTSN|nr:hypothetical protein DOTSEDRAFT_31159 [Dothistroma septosporum NZE10]